MPVVQPAMRTIVAVDFSPQRYARIGGALYLLIIAAGVFAELVVRESLIVPHDAALTARNITDHALMFRLGIAADLSTFLVAVVLTVILYQLTKPVDRTAALLMLGFNLVQDAIGGINAMNTYRPLLLLGSAGYVKVFSSEQLAAMALVSLNAHSVGFAIALLFFGCSCLALGYLTVHSGFLPKGLGILMALAGACYVANSAATILSPRLAALLFPSILAPAFIGELSFAVWLTVKGLDSGRWQEIAGRSPAS